MKPVVCSALELSADSHHIFLGKMPLKTLAGGLPLHTCRAHQRCCPIPIPTGSPPHPPFTASWSNTHGPVHPLSPLTLLSLKRGFPSLLASPMGFATASLQPKECQEQSTAEVIWAGCRVGHCCHIWDLLLGQSRGCFGNGRDLWVWGGQPTAGPGEEGVAFGTQHLWR